MIVLGVLLLGAGGAARAIAHGAELWSAAQEQAYVTAVEDALYKGKQLSYDPG